MNKELGCLFKEKLGLEHYGIIHIPIKDSVIQDPVFMLNENQAFEAGSMLKTTIGAVALMKVESGKLAMNEVKPLLQSMIVDSNNEATKELVALTDRNFIRQIMDEIGMRQSRLYDPNTRKLSRVTPADMAQFLTRLLKRELIQDNGLMTEFESMLHNNKTRDEWLSLPVGASFFGIPSVIRSRGRVIGKHVVNYGGWFDFDDSPGNRGIVVICSDSLVGLIDHLTQLTSQQVSGFINSL